MSTPLSPLTTSRQNSRTLSSNLGDTTPKRGSLDGLLAASGATENAFLSPKKSADNSRRNSRHSLSYEAATEEYEAQEAYGDNEDAEYFQHMQSSPFRYDGRDDTVDFQMLQRHQSSLGITGERSATPRKRSYEQAPDIHDEDIDRSVRCKKGMGRRDIPDIDIYSDEDVEHSHGQSPSESTGRDMANSMVEERNNEGMSSVLHEDTEDISSENRGNMGSHDTDEAMTDDDSHDPMDDTCFSTFSAVPNVDMTAFANLSGNSPGKSPRPPPKRSVDVDETKHEDIEPATPTTARRSPRKTALIDLNSSIASPTPRKRDPRDGQDPTGTPNLLDLTDQPSFFPRRPRYSLMNERYTPSRRSPLRSARESIRSPSKMTLLDFDIPSAPTPRSIPTITPRELETLKSGFLSEISSLKATLSGKEAEVSSLKQAVTDAERRVGEALEEVRNEAARKEALEIEQAEWQRRGREMEEVLRSVKADIVEGERERERLVKKMEEAEKGKEQLESRMVELESRLTAARKSATCEHGASENAASSPAMTAEETAREVQDAVEKVARELHTLYKNKHETKVAALKKSYEARWEKRLREAENKLKAANQDNERLKAERDAAVHENARPHPSTISHDKEEHEAEKRVLEARLEGLRQEMEVLKKDNEQLHAELKVERAEKGELVAAVDEWLAMQNPAPAPQSEKEVTPEPAPQEVYPVPEEPERDITPPRPSGIRGPSSSSTASSNTGERKIPKIGAPASRHGRGNSGGKSGIAVFTPGRSGIMGSIERMGRGGAA